VLEKFGKKEEPVPDPELPVKLSAPSLTTQKVVKAPTIADVGEAGPEMDPGVAKKAVAEVKKRVDTI